MHDEPGGALGAAQRRAGRGGAAAYAFATCLAVTSAVGAIALVVKQPYLFPSLGPTVMLFFESPLQKSAAPRSTLVGHGVAILAGIGCLALLGLTAHPSVTEEGVTGPRIVAAALSVALTAFVLRLLDCPHPPAGATTLIISLGLLTSVVDIAVAVVLVTVLGVAVNRVLGVGQSLWR
ncbi:HPP family protein [Saccharomonospora cyanea]|uniref:CBS-domain-containing membrane protein n=1 Tax=Saccharomonospora cyanea NA-134 TaxID=882082 RepID=H5XIB1_9PSEU|nr:HPP family protein [Saccharomonospora cyanea]EHR61739.1 CBS-domain-containing membrane protein [Saccharomonospora cyanea NA-134]